MRRNRTREEPDSIGYQLSTALTKESVESTTPGYIVLDEPKNGTHKNFALPNCNICKQGSENSPVNHSNRSSTYVITSLTNVTASCCRSLSTLTEVEEPAEMGKPLGTSAHRHRSILPSGVRYVPRPWVLQEYRPTGPSLLLPIVTVIFLCL